MRIFIIAFLLFLQMLPALAAPTQQELAEFYTKEEISEELNAYAQLRELDEVAVDGLKPSFNCTNPYDAQRSYIPIKDFSCIDEAELQQAWADNSEIISQYAYIIKMQRFYEDQTAEKLNNFINVNRLISTKIQSDIAAGNEDAAYHIWSNNMKFLQMAIADKQDMVVKSILFIAYELYTSIAPTLLSSNIEEAQKAQIRKLLNFEIANAETGWNIADSLAMDYHNITDEIDNAKMEKLLAVEVYELAQDALKLYDYEYNVIEEQVQKLTEKYQMSFIEAAGAASASGEKTAAIMVIEGLSAGLKLMTLAKFKDIQSKIAALKY